MEPKKFLLRINPELWTQIERLAQEELRSVNGQIEYILKEAIRKRRSSESPQTRESGETDES